MNEFDPSMGQYRQTTPWNLRHIITGWVIFHRHCVILI